MYRTVSITEDSQGVTSRLLYEIAVARVDGIALLRFDLLHKNPPTLSGCRRVALRVLRALKKAGRIKLLLCSEDYGESKTEVMYLENKFPALSEDDSLVGPVHPYLLIEL